MSLPSAAAAEAGKLIRTLAAESWQSLTCDVLQDLAVAGTGL